MTSPLSAAGSSPASLSRFAMSTPAASSECGSRLRHSEETSGEWPTLDDPMHTRIHACMATKTISIDLEAYERLRRARRLPNESFSKVIKRAEWPLQPRTAGALLSAMAKIAPVDKEVIDRLDTAQGLDRPPEDPWRDD